MSDPEWMTVLSPTEAKLAAYLSDGKPRTVAECLMGAWGKRAASENLINQHAYRMRPKLAPFGLTIVGVGNGFQLVKTTNL